MPGSGDKALARRLADRFPSRFLRSYVYWKVRSDPVYRAVAGVLAAAKPLPLLDLGCGAGLLAHYLRECGFREPMHGVDLDEPKIAVARQISAQTEPTLTFDCCDFREVRTGGGHVTMLDVLLFVPADQQAEMLSRIASFVHPEHGVLIVRSGIGDGSWRHRLTHGMDILAKLIRWMPVRPASYPSRELFSRVLEAAGFSVEFRPLWGRTPFNNHLIVARRKA